VIIFHKAKAVVLNMDLLVISFQILKEFINRIELFINTLWKSDTFLVCVID